MCAKVNKKRTPDEPVRRNLRRSSRGSLKSSTRRRGSGLLRRSERGIGARIQATEPSPTINRTPQRGAHRTMSSKQRQTNNKTSGGKPSEDETSYGSIENEFLGKRPSTTPIHRSSIETDPLGSQPSDASSDDESDTQQQSSRTKPTTNRRPPRKQIKPKKRKNRIIPELLKLQSTNNLIIPRMKFHCLVFQVMQTFETDYRMQSSTLECLHEAAENYLVSLFEDSQLLCSHLDIKTLNENHFRSILMLRGPLDAGR